MPHSTSSQVPNAVAAALGSMLSRWKATASMPCRLSSTRCWPAAPSGSSRSASASASGRGVNRTMAMLALCFRVAVD